MQQLGTHPWNQGEGKYSIDNVINVQLILQDFRLFENNCEL